MASQYFKVALATCIGLAAAYSNSPAQQTKVLTAEKHNEYGLVYSLPLTALRIDVTARHTIRKAGPFYQYARKHMGTDKAVTADSEEWIVTSVSMTPYGVTDSSRQYIMQLKPGAVTFIGVSSDGMLLSINKRPENRPEAGSPVKGSTSESSATPVEPSEYLQYVDEDFIASQSTAKQAQMLAESLMEIRDAKISLTRGTADAMPTDGRQLELMLNSLAHQEAAMSAAFLGSVQTETVTRTFTYLPDSEGSETLFRLSDFGGFVDADDYSGEPVTISVEITNSGELPKDAKGDEKKLPKDAVMYCIPGSANISLSLKGETIFDQEFDFSQYGIEFGLSPTLFTDKKTPSFATFNPATGAVEEIGALKEDFSAEE